MNPKLKPIQDQVVVLMGATSGIGLETAKLMAEKGARLAIIGRSQEGLNDALDKVRMHVAGLWSQEMGPTETGFENAAFTSEGGSMPASSMPYGGSVSAPVVTLEEQVMAVEADVTSFDQVKSAADQVVQRFGRIDTWVNVTGVSEWALFEDTSPDEFHRIIEVNLLGQSYGAMAALPYLKQQASGALIFISSITARVPVAYQAAYNASKHGIVGLADTLRVELAYTGIPVSVTTILPASMNTPLFEKARTKMGVEPQPVPPVYEAAMTAQAILYAAQHAVPELVVGDAGHMVSFMSRLAPGLTNKLVGARSMRTQQTNRVKSAQSPDNLYEHVPGHDQAEGNLMESVMYFSPLTWLSTHPKARMAILGGLIGGTGLLIGWRVVSERQRRRTWQYRLPRMVNKYSHQYSKQAVKATEKALKATQHALKDMRGSLADMPMVSGLPMFHQPNLFERSSEILLGIWAALTSLSLPFLRRRKPLPKRVASKIADISSDLVDRVPSVSMPWNRKPSMIERMSMARQRKAAMRTVNKMGSKMLDQMSSQMDDTRKKAAKTIDKARDQAADTRKQAQKSAKQAQKSAKKAARTLQKQAAAMSEHNRHRQKEVVVRRSSLIERLPFGERRETVIETKKVPNNN